MPANNRHPSIIALEEKAVRISDAVKAKPTVDQFFALKDDLEVLSTSLEPASCSGQQLGAVLASRIPADLIHTAMAGLELLAQASSATSEAAKSLSDPLDLLGRPLTFLVSAAAAAGKRRKAVPPGFLASWGAAAAPAAANLQQHCQEVPPTSTTCGVLALVVALLRLWRVAALHYYAASAAAGGGSAATPPSVLLASMPLAADLSLLLLTSPGAAAAFPQELQTTSPGHASVKLLQHAAATTLHVMASVVASAGVQVMGPQFTTLPAGFVADSVQRALVLQMAACMPYCMQQMEKQPVSNRSASSKKAGGKGNSGRNAPAAPPSPAVVAAADSTARKQLQQLGLQRQQDLERYGRVACEHAGIATDDGDTPRGHLRAAYGGVQLAFVLRRQAMGHPMWPTLYRGAITRPPQVAAAGVVNSLLAPVMAPGVDPLLLQELLLHLMMVLGVGDAVSMSAGLGIGQNSLQPATPRSGDKAGVARCLELLWLGLGRELLHAAGVTGAELDDDAEADTGNDQGRLPQLRNDGSTEVTAATASEMLLQYGYLLIQAFVWHSEFLPPAQDLFQQQPQLACRVLEAAARSCTWPGPYAPPQTDASDTAKHFKGLYLATAACMPASPELAPP